MKEQQIHLYMEAGPTPKFSVLAKAYQSGFLEQLSLPTPKKNLTSKLELLFRETAHTYTHTHNPNHAAAVTGELHRAAQQLPRQCSNIKHHTINSHSRGSAVTFMSPQSEYLGILDVNPPRIDAPAQIVLPMAQA